MTAKGSSSLRTRHPLKDRTKKAAAEIQTN
jgi:hypothetical protein